MLAIAPLAASMPLQTRRLTMSLSTLHGPSLAKLAVNQLLLLPADGTEHQRGSRPSQMVATSSVFAWSKSLSAAGITSKIQPERSCSTAP